MRHCITAIFLGCLFNTGAQVSVYSCTAHPDVTPAMINAAGTEFYQACVNLDPTQTFNYNGTSNKKIVSASSIHVNPNFHAGPYTTGKMWLKIDNATAFDVAVMNYTDLKGILRYERLELGVQLPTDIQANIDNFLINNTMGTQTNPFVDWELKVETTFTHVATSTTKKVDGFFYRDFFRKSNTSWKEIATDYNFRVRFAPPLNGMWTAKVKIIFNGVLHSESASFSFNTIESGNPGYVKVHENNKNLKRGNNVVFPVGQNLPWPDDGGVWFGDRATPLDWITYLNQMQSYSDLGGDYVRSIIHPHSMDIEWEKLGNYYDRMDYAWEMDNMLTLIEDNDMMLDLNLFNHNTYQKVSDYAQFRWDFSDYQPNGGPDPGGFEPYCYRNGLVAVGGVALSEPKELFTNTIALKYLKQRARYLISRYGYSTNIYMLELGSEMYHLNESYTYDTTANANVPTRPTRWTI